MKKELLFLVIAFNFGLTNVFSQLDEAPIKKSIILFTQESTATPFNYEKYKADGVFWGHMPNSSIESDAAINQWVTRIENRTENGKYHFGRGEFDWGWKWMIDFMDNPGAYWSKDLNGNNILWGNGDMYNGHRHSWQSHQGPEFLEWLKYQVDRMTLAPVTHMMFDSQTSASRTLHWLGGDFSVTSMNGFRSYMKNKYSTQELNNLEIPNINNFNYRQFLLNKGFNLNTFRNRAGTIEGDIPLYKDFVYFQRQALNDVMDELFDYIDTKRPGIAIGATTNVVEPRGFIFSDRLTYLAGEYGHPHDPAKSPPFEPLLHYKAAEDLNKTLIYFPYPDAFRDLYNRNAPRQSRAWIAQAYATGSVFSVPGNVWIGGTDTWNPGWQNIADIYEFIHDHSELFNDYKALSNVALTYSVYASLLEWGMDGSAKARETLEYLVKENISFDLKIFGDPDRPIAPTSEELNKYDVVVHDSDIQYLTAEQNQILNANSNVVSIDNPNNIKNRLSWKIDVLKNGAKRNNLISALPRISPNEAAPYVIHLINRKYNANNDSAQTQNDISVKIPTAMFQNSILGAKLHLPGKPSIDLSFVTNNSDFITLNIGTFDSCWGIIELTNDYVLSDEDANFNSKKVSIYPNPSNDYINIKNTSIHDISFVQIYNIEGKEIMKKEINSTHSINISSLAKGVYIVKISDYLQNTVIEKLIKN